MAAPYEAKAALKALLEAHIWPGTTPKVSWGDPGSPTDKALERIYQGDITVTGELRKLGMRRVEETFDLVVVVDVFKYGNDEQATEARAWQLRDEVVGVLMANRNLGGTVDYIAGFGPAPTATPPKAEGWRTQIVLRVACVTHADY